MTNKDLQHIAPTLAKLQSKKSGFVIPEDYLGTFEYPVIEKLQVNNQVFNIPDNYFDTVEDKVMKTLQKEEPRKYPFVYNYLLPISIAASLVLLFTIYHPFNKTNEISNAEISAYLSEDIIPIDEEDITEIFKDELDKIALQQNITNKDIEEYLLNNLSDEDLYN